MAMNGMNSPYTETKMINVVMVPGPTSNGVAKGTAAKLWMPRWPTGITRHPKTNLMPKRRRIMPPAILKSASAIEKKFNTVVAKKRKIPKIIAENIVVFSAQSFMTALDFFLRQET